MPIIASFRYAASQLPGAAIASTTGHLMVLTGHDGNHVFVNDPAAPTRSEVPRRYPLEAPGGGRPVAEVGEFEQGAAVADEALALAEGLGQPDALIGAHMAVGVVALGKGDLLDAIRALEQSVQLFRRWDHPAWYGSASFLAIGYTLTGRVDEATALAVQTVEQYDSMGMRCNEALWIAFLGEAYLGAGSPDDAPRRPP